MSIESAYISAKQALVEFAGAPEIVFPNSSSGAILPRMEVLRPLVNTQRQFLDGTGQIDAIMQINVVVEENTGEREIHRLTDIVLEVFPAGAEFDGAEVLRRPFNGPFSLSDGEYRTSMTVPLRIVE